MNKLFRLFFLVIKKIFLLVYLIWKTSFKGSSQNANCKVVFWTPRYNWKYFISDRIVTDFAYANSLSKRNIKFYWVKSMDIGKYWDRIIYINYDYKDNLFRFDDYTKQLYFIIQQLEKQNNIVYPTSSEYLFWENKGYMHQIFKQLHIPHPSTKIIDSFDKFEPNQKDYPFLIKEIHSCSANGVHKITCEDDFKLIKSKLRNSTFLVQELLNMRRDLRVTLVGDKIEHFYWRINNAKDWKPTSTGHGSSVDFITFPEQWRDFIINEFKKLNIVTGAFDIAWQNDDLNTTPLFLEISPTYQLNPVTKNIKHIEAYGKYKKQSIFGKQSYLYQFVVQSFEIIDKIVDCRIRTK